MRTACKVTKYEEENKFNNNQLKICSFLHFPFRYRNNQILNPPFFREHTIFYISLFSSLFLSNLFKIFCQYKSYTFLTNVKSTVASRNVYYISQNVRLKVLRSLWKHTHAWKRFLKSLKLIELACTFQLLCFIKSSIEIPGKKAIFCTHFEHDCHSRYHRDGPLFQKIHWKQERMSTLCVTWDPNDDWAESL